MESLSDFMLGVSPSAPNINRRRIGFYDFSLGGYTGLVLVVGNPDWAAATEFCRRSSWRWCEQIRRKEFPAEVLAHDPRIKAAVIANPLGFLYRRQSRPVRVPVQLWVSEIWRRRVTNREVAAVHSKPAGGARILRGAECQALRLHSSHAATQAALNPEVFADAPGFDRAAFHKEFNAAVLAFFRVHRLGLDNRPCTDR